MELTEVEADTGYDREAVPCDYTVYSSVQCAESGRFYWLTYRNTCPRFVELPRLLEHNRVLQFPLETAPETPPAPARAHHGERDCGPGAPAAFAEAPTLPSARRR